MYSTSVSGRKKNPFLNWFALCHCHTCMFPILTGSYVLTLCPAHRLPCEIDLCCTGWVFLNWLIYCFCMFLEREETARISQVTKESRGGRGRGKEQRPLLLPQSIKYLNNCWKQIISSLSLVVIQAGELWPFVDSLIEMPADASQNKWLSLSLINLSYLISIKLEGLAPSDVLSVNLSCLPNSPPSSQ